MRPKTIRKMNNNNNTYLIMYVDDLNHILWHVFRRKNVYQGLDVEVKE